MKITKTVLKKWSPCASGYGWFLANFPKGGTFLEIVAELTKQGHYPNTRWLIRRVYRHVVAGGTVGVAEWREARAAAADAYAAPTSTPSASREKWESILATDQAKKKK